MDELDHRSQFVVMGALIPQGAGRKQHQRGPHAFSTTIDNVLRHLANQDDIGVKAVANDGVDGLHIGPDEGVELFERHSEEEFYKASNLRRRHKQRQGRQINPALG